MGADQRGGAGASGSIGSRGVGLRTLLVSLLALIVLNPFLEGSVAGRITMLLVSSVVILSGVWAASEERRGVAIGIALAVPALAVRWSEILFDAGKPPSLSENHGLLNAASVLLFLVFLSYTVVVVSRRVLRARRVTADELCGALSIYVMIGIIWGFVFGLLEIRIPHSFRIGGEALTMSHLVYYSFVTLMTVGYGDIVPNNSFARLFSVLEAMTGVFYLAVLIARLVSAYARDQQS